MNALQNKIIEHLQNAEIPDFSFIYSDESLKEAPAILEYLLDEEKKEFQNIINSKKEDLSFDLINKDELLEYYYGLLSHYESVESTDTIRKIIEDFEPKYIAFSQEVSYSPEYYQILKYLQEKDYDDEIQRILTKQIEAFERRGIHLPEDDQNRLKEIDLKLSELSQKFGQNLIDDQNEFEYELTSDKYLKRLPEDALVAAQQKYSQKYPGTDNNGYIFGASAGEYINIIKYCDNSEVRRDFYMARQSFGAKGKYDNTEIISQILTLRNEKAKILGLENYNELSLQTKMAGSVEEILDFFESIKGPLQTKSEREKQDLETFAGRELQAWDMAYYSTLYKEQHLKIDDKEVRKYFPYKHVHVTMFDFASKLYGLEFEQVATHTYFQDAGGELWKVYSEGEFISYLLFDPFYRKNKRPGAWASILRDKSNFNGKKLSKITLNVGDIQKNNNKVTLLTIGDVETLFHEFGHAMHAMLAKSEYSELGMFSLEWDFLELPSQLNENWIRHPNGLKKITSHFKTGEIISQSYIDKIESARFFGIGRRLLSQVMMSILDLKLHEKAWNKDELKELVQNCYEDIMKEDIPEGYFILGNMLHFFDGGPYASGYYSYLWAEILEKDVWESFLETGDIFDSEQAKKYKKYILEAGSSKDSAELFEDFLGRPPSKDAFLRQNNIIK